MVFIVKSETEAEVLPAQLDKTNMAVLPSNEVLQRAQLGTRSANRRQGFKIYKY